MRVRFTIYWEDLRIMCIEHNYYTCGNNNEYDRMLNKYQGEFLAPTKLKGALEDLAGDIKEHSLTEDSVIQIAQYISDIVKIEVF